MIYAFDPSTDEFIPAENNMERKKRGDLVSADDGNMADRLAGGRRPLPLGRCPDDPDVDNGNLDLDITLSEAGDYILEILVFDRGKILIKNDYRLQGDNLKTVLKIFNGGIMERGVHNPGKLWSPENPYLFDIHFRLCCDGREVDFVKSYFGMRKIHAEEYLLNIHMPKLVQIRGIGKRGR